MDSNRIIINSEEEAWRLFQDIHAGAKLPEGVEIEFGQWPVMRLHFTGPSWNETIPARMLQPVLRLQNDIYRTYALARYGDKGTLLSREEKARLEILLQIRKGGTWLDVLMSQPFTDMTRDLAKMIPPDQLTILVVGLALTAGGVTTLKHWLMTRRDIIVRKAELETLKEIVMTEEETKRMAIMAEAKALQPKLARIDEMLDDSRRQLLKPTRGGDTIEIAGVELDGETVKHFTRVPRRIPIPVRFDGVFRIQQVDASRDDGFTLKVIPIHGGASLSAYLPNATLSIEMREMLQSAEWERKRVRLAINAKRLDDAVSSAEVVSCEKADGAG